MAVVLFHLKIFQLGWAGVDLFFVISGYIMGSVGSTQTAKTFILGRFTRIVPFYWLVTVGVCLTSLVPGLFRTFTFTYNELLNSLFFIPYVNRAGNAWPLIVPGWTLNFEIFFYGLFTLGLLVKAPLKLSVASLLALVVAGAMLHPQNVIFQTWTSPILIEFAAGLIISSVDFPSHKAFGFLLAALGAAGGAIAYISAMGDQITFSRTLICGSSAAMIVAGALALEKVDWWPSRTMLFEKIGDSSYSLYLIHGLVIAATEKLFVMTLFVKINTFLACLGCGWLVYRCIEMNVTRVVKRKLDRKPQALNVGYNNSLAA